MPVTLCYPQYGLLITKLNIMKEFNKEDLEFYLKDKPFKGLSKEYIMEAIFNDAIQKNGNQK